MRKRWRTQTAAMNAMKDALEAEGIVIPFPQQTLSARTEGASGPQLDAAVEGRAATRGGSGDASDGNGDAGDGPAESTDGAAGDGDR
jgi:small-conductance mechanosensitive channel